MSAFSRLVAVLAGLAGVIFAAAALAREVVMASDASVVWTLPDWWQRITEESPRSLTGAVAAAVAVAAAGLLILAVRQLGFLDRRPGLVEYADESGSARLDVPALERALAHRLESELPGMKTHGVGLDKRGNGWLVRVEAELPARDLAGVREKAFALLAADLERTGTLKLTRLDIVALRPGARAGRG